MNIGDNVDALCFKDILDHLIKATEAPPKELAPPANAVYPMFSPNAPTYRRFEMDDNDDPIAYKRRMEMENNADTTVQKVLTYDIYIYTIN